PDDEGGKGPAAGTAARDPGDGDGGAVGQPADHARRGQDDPGRQPRRGYRLRQLPVRLAPDGDELMGTGQLGQESETGPLRVRAFFGLPVPDAQRDLLERYLAECAAKAAQFRWTPAANLHLTVRFMGHLEQNTAE